MFEEGWSSRRHTGFIWSKPFLLIDLSYRLNTVNSLDISKCLVCTKQLPQELFDLTEYITIRLDIFWFCNNLRFCAKIFRAQIILLFNFLTFYIDFVITYPSIEKFEVLCIYYFHILIFFNIEKIHIAFDVKAAVSCAKQELENIDSQLLVNLSKQFYKSSEKMFINT